MRTRLRDLLRGEAPLRSRRARYGFALIAIAVVFALRVLLAPLNGGTGVFALLLAATVVTTLVSGVGPALLGLVAGLLAASFLFLVPAGLSLSRIVIQFVLHGLAGLGILYLAYLTTGRRQSLVAANRRLEAANDERSRLLEQERMARLEAESTTNRLRESEERFRLTVENAPIGMALVALDGRFVRVNQALCEITGYRADELTELTFQDITHPDDLDSDVEAAGRLARGEVSRYQFEKRYVRKDGSIVDIMLSTAPLRAPDGSARYYISQMEDITTRKRAEEALRVSQAKFSGIVSIAADAIISVDAEQRITIFNNGAERIFGYTKEEAIGSALERLIPERFRAAHRDHFARFAAGTESARPMGERREIFGLRKNGDEFPAEGSISKVSVAGTTLFSVVLRDVTHRKSVETALQHAVAARDHVLGIVAHDLRNPLSTIIMQASLLERVDGGPERRDQTPRLVISRSATRMNRLISDLLDVALIEAGELKVERTPLSAADLARDAVESQLEVASAAGVALELGASPDAREILGDRDRLLQVFDNLIGNAIKFTARGGHITVRVAAKPDETEFSVSDTGCGISPENLPRVFDSFWQAATRLSRLGAGLGLPITKGIVEAHGGRISVESVVDRGSTFSFTVPNSTPSGGSDPTAP